MKFQIMDPINKYLLHLRSIWTQTVFLNESILSDEFIDARQFLNHPLRLSHPLIEILSYLLIQKVGETPPPLREEIKTLPIGEQCQLALLRDIACGNGQSLGRKILPFLSFPSLWCAEGAYDVKETEIACALLSHAFRRDVPVPVHEDSYFEALAAHLPTWDEGDTSSEDFPAVFYKGPNMHGALVKLGVGVPLGALVAFPPKASPPSCKSASGDFLSPGVSVPAFGPQVHPLNDPQLFGIYRTVPDSRYGAVFANKEVWFETIPVFDRGELEVRCKGLPSDKPISFVYYIQADIAKIGQESYLPKSLNRYSGGVKNVRFERNGSGFSIESIGSLRMELIPLAGSGCFWDSDFLLSFEIPVHDGRILFKWIA